MLDTTTMPVLLEPQMASAPTEVALAPAPQRRRGGLRRLVVAVWRGVSSLAEWLFGVVSLVLGLAILAALPVLQLVTLGYLLESSARVARTGRLRYGLIGVRRAARVGGVVAGIWLCLLPLGLVDSFARSAELIDPGGRVARGWRFFLIVLTVLTFLHLCTACARGGRLRYFLWPLGNPFWLRRRLRTAGLYSECRDGFWTFVAALHFPHYFRLGLVGFLGTLAWIVVPATLISQIGRVPLVGVLGVLTLAVVAPWLPFLQVHYAVEGRASALFAVRAIRDRFRRAPWAFAFALLLMLLAAIPLYLLKIEMLPREAAWLPSLVFVIFLFPARILVGWAYSRSGRRDRPRHWFFRTFGRLAIIPAAALYVVVVFISQYTSWGGAWGLYEQHAFLLPVPFLNM